MTDRVSFTEVVDAWKVAPVTAIHPLRHVSDEAYWASGRQQALDAAQWLDDGATVMDFGCGDGRVAIPLAKLGYEVWAVDASEEMLYRLKENAHAADLSITVVHSDGTDLPADLSVDAVHARAVFIHHSHADVGLLVHALARHLKPGGVLIADWPVGAHYVRQNWTDVTTWRPKDRLEVALRAGFTPLHPGTDAHGAPSVWRKL